MKDSTRAGSLRQAPAAPPTAETAGDRRRRRKDRRVRRALDTQVKVLAPLAVVWIGASFALTLVARARPDLAGELLLDPTYFTGAHWYTGLVSDIGVMAWTVAAAAAGLGWWTARVSDRVGAARMLAGAAFLSAYLALDDLLQLHIDLIGRVVPLGKPLVELAIAAFTVRWAWTNRSELARTRYVVLAASVAALATSIVVDAVLDPAPDDWSLLWEDGAKLLGVLAWATFFVLTTADIAASVARVSRRARSSGPRKDLDSVAGGVPGETPAGEAVEEFGDLPASAGG